MGASGSCVQSRRACVCPAQAEMDATPTIGPFPLRRGRQTNTHRGGLALKRTCVLHEHVWAQTWEVISESSSHFAHCVK
jgi:hypothetical protein